MVFFFFFWDFPGLVLASLDLFFFFSPSAGGSNWRRFLILFFLLFWPFPVPLFGVFFLRMRVSQREGLFRPWQTVPGRDSYARPVTVFYFYFLAAFFPAERED